MGVCSLLRSVYASPEERELLDRVEDHLTEAKEILYMLFADLEPNRPRQETIF